MFEAAPRPANAARSDVAVDVFRGIVVVMMFAVHARRIQVGHGSGALEHAADACLRFSMRIEPYIAAAFLYLVGFSLVLSWWSTRSRHPDGELPALGRRWRTRMFRRAAWLYLLSVGLCVPQFGLQWPATFVSSGILSVIALAIVVCAALLTTSGGRRLAWPLCTLVLLVTSVLHAAKLGVSGLNAGPGGTFPLLAASLFGMLSAPQRALTFGSQQAKDRGQDEHRARRLSANSGSAATGSVPALGAPTGETRAAMTLRSPWLVVCLAIGGYELFDAGLAAPWTDTFTSNYRDYSGLAALFWLENGPKLPSQWTASGFWNHTSYGLIGCMLAIWSTHQLLHALFNPRASQATHGGAEAVIRYKPFILTSLGEHALVAYITHLLALGLVEMFGLAPTSSIGTWGLVFLLIILSLVIAPLVQRVFQRRLSSKHP